MSFPRNNDVFPPTYWRKAYDKYAEFDILYSGVGQLVPIPGDISNTSANLLFGESPKMIVSDEATQERLDEIVARGDLWSKLLEAGESASALGGVFIKPNWDAEFIGVPVMSVVQADNAFPQFRWGFLETVLFWEEVLVDEETYWRLFEYHEKGLISYKLYKGERDNVGIEVGLGALAETAELPEEVRTGLDTIAVRYVPNMMPNRYLRGKSLGRSDYAGIEETLSALDLTYRSWVREIKLGKARLTVPELWLDGQQLFDTDKEIFTTLNVDPINAQGLKPEMIQFTLRVDEHAQTCTELLNRCITSAGYSPQSFGLSINGQAESGTALNIRERKSLTTKAKKEQFFKRALEDVLEMMLIIDRNVFGSGVVIERPSIEFQDGMSFDLETTAKSVEMIYRAQAASAEVRVRMLHPDWNQPQVEEEVGKIMMEAGMAEPDFGGGV
jgi:A118 family predicted phage portal protein